MEITRYALVNFSMGRALVVESDGSWWTLETELDAVNGPVRAEQGLHLGMWLQPAECQTLDPGVPPYEDIKARMLLESRLVRAVLCWCLALDPKQDEHERREAAALLNERLADDEVYARFRDFILVSSFPPDASAHDAPFTGRAAVILELVLKKLGLKSVPSTP
ncbi:hypothetical protein HY631_04205 [Candidatus Uhrbacteria bacterium]|nr:hypothetical protein [Candidatus Uhrbacteria bacterium]